MPDYHVTLIIKGPDGTKTKSQSVDFDYWNAKVGEHFKLEGLIRDTAKFLADRYTEDEFYGDHRY